MREVTLVFSVKASTEVDATQFVKALLDPTSPPAQYHRLSVDKAAPGFYEVRVSASSPPLSHIEHAITQDSSILSFKSL